MKIVWKTEISTLLMAAAPHAALKRNRTNMIMPKTTAPMTLNSRWITEALFAFFPAPALEIRAVTQVPIFWPSVMNTADCQFTTPLSASVCRIPTEAEELWIMAVTTAPASTARTGFLPRTAKACANMGASLYGLIASDMKERPINRILKPTRISPIFFFFSDFVKSTRNAPIPKSSGAKNSGFITLPIRSWKQSMP